MSVIVLCDWPADQGQFRDAVLQEAAKLVLSGRGGLLFLAANAEIGKVVAALRYTRERDATRFRQRAETLAGADAIVMSAMVEQEHPLPIGLSAMFP